MPRETDSSRPPHNDSACIRQRGLESEERRHVKKTAALSGQDYAAEFVEAMEPKNNTSNHTREQRQLELHWLTAKTLVHIDEKLTDLVTLQQQEVDLLRRLVERSALP